MDDRNEVFMSYRRADVEFAKKLHRKLKETDRNIWVDWENIPPGVEGFSDEIQRGIEGSDAFICILSPSYLESEYCLMELREALKLKKRVIPLILKKFEPTPPPEGIGHINWIYFTPHAGQKNIFDESFPKVIKALEADYEHTREHTRLLLRAIDWQKNQEGKSYLLKDAEIDKAERWQVAAIAKNPTPTELQGEYVLTSRSYQRQQQRRLMAVIGILLGFAVLAAIVAGFQWNSAVRSEKTAVAAKNDALTQKVIADNQRATAQAAEATAVVAKQEAETQRTIAQDEEQNALISGLAAQSQITRSRQLSILLALEAYNVSRKKGEIDPAVQTSLRSSLLGFSGVPVHSYQTAATFTQFSPDDRWLISSADNGQIQVSDLTKGLNSQPVTLMDKTGKRNIIVDLNNKPKIVISPDSQWLAGIYFDNDTNKKGIWVWSLNNLDSGPQTLDLPQDATLPLAIVFSTIESKQYWLAVGLEDGSIYTWNVSDLPNAKATLFYKKDKFGRSASKILFSPDGTWLVVAFQPADPYGAQDTTSPVMLIWNMTNLAGEPIMVDLLQSPISNLTFSDSGKWLAGFSNSQIDGLTKLRFWNMSTLTPTTTSAAYSLNTDTGISIAFSPDDRWVAAVGGNNAEVWSLNNFSSIKLPGYKDIVLTVSFSPDGQSLATGDYDGQIRLWKTADFSNAPLVESQAHIYSSFDVIVQSLNFNSDGSQLAAAGDQQVRVWNLPISISDPVKSPSYQGSYLALKNSAFVQDSADSMYVLDLSGNEPTVVVETTQKNPIGYYPSPDERYLAVTSEKQIQVWDLQNPGKPLFESERENGRFNFPTFTADSHWFVYSVYNQIFALDLQKHDAPIVLSGNRTVSPILAFYSFKHWLISQSSSEILAWDTASGLSRPVKISNVQKTTSVTINNDSTWLFIQQQENLSAWNSSDFSTAPIVIKGTFSQLIHDRWLLTSTTDNQSILWDLSQPDAPVATAANFGVSESQNWFYYYDDENTLRSLDLKSANPKPVVIGNFKGSSPTFGLNDHWMAIISDDGSSTWVYELTKDLPKFQLSDVIPLNITPDGHWLALQTVDQKKDMVLYDLQAHKQLSVTYPPTSSIDVISSDGRWAAGSLIGNNNTNTLLIDLQNPEKFYSLTGHTDVLNGKFFTPDQSSLLTYGFDGTVRVWNLANPAGDPVVLSHDAAVFNAQLSGNGKWLISSTSNNVYIWQWDFGNVHDLACRLVGRNLTQVEWKKYLGATDYSKTCDQWP